MGQTDPSMAALGDLLPFADARDNLQRLSKLDDALRRAPVSGAGSEIFELAADALAALPFEPQVAGRAMCWIGIARKRFICAQPFSALDAAAEAVAIADRVHDDLVIAKALKFLGFLYAETGNYPAATDMLMRALDAARRAGEAQQQAEIFMNLGIAHQYAGQFSVAVPCYERAAAIASAAQAPLITRATPFSNSALAYLYLRDLPRGMTAAEQAIALLAEPQTAEERIYRAMTEYYYVRLLLEARNVPRAIERAKLAKMYAQGAGQRAEMYADMALGLTEAHGSDGGDLGLSRLEQVVSKAREGFHSMLRDGLATLVHAYQAANQPTEALVRQRQVIDLDRGSRVKDLLVHHGRNVVEVAKGLDERAQAALSLQREELQFQRFSAEQVGELTRVLEVNTVAVELHDDDTGGHCFRVGKLSSLFAAKLGWDDDECRLIDYCARLHDIGKIRLPQDLLFVPRKFTADERLSMQRHCEFGRDIIGETGLGQLELAKEIAYNHHERWDGSGYPRGIRGELIPLVARIIALVDVYDALVHKRCYKPAWSVKDALLEIFKQRRKHFDPKLVRVFVRLVRELQAEHGDLDGYLSAEALKNEFIINRAKLARELADYTL